MAESGSVDDLIIKVAKKVGVYTKEIAKLHGFRHYFAVEIFKESGYNLSVVKYLLGHKDYRMSQSYLVQEQEKEILKVREATKMKGKKYTGLGIENIINSIINGKTNKFVLKKKLNNMSKEILEVIDMNSLHKLEIGYCLDICDKAFKCYKCNNFLVEKGEVSLLIEYAKEMLEVILYKKLIIKNDSIIEKDLDDLMYLINEIEALGVDEKDLWKQLSGDVYDERK